MHLLVGNFNKDGDPDYAVVGKYDGPDGDRSIFVAIFGLRKNRVKLDFVSTFRNDRAFLNLEPGGLLSVKNINKKLDVVVVALALEATTDSGSPGMGENT